MVDRRLRDEEDDMGVQTMAIRCEGCASCDGVLWRRRACSCAHLWCCEESTLLVGVILCVFSVRVLWVLCSSAMRVVFSSSW